MGTGLVKFAGRKESEILKGQTMKHVLLGCAVLLIALVAFGAGAKVEKAKKLKYPYLPDRLNVEKTVVVAELEAKKANFQAAKAIPVYRTKHGRNQGEPVFYIVVGVRPGEAKPKAEEADWRFLSDALWKHVKATTKFRRHHQKHGWLPTVVAVEYKGKMIATGTINSLHAVKRR